MFFQEGEDDDFYASFTGFEDRVFNLEKSWKKLDQQLQKGAENMDLLHKKLGNYYHIVNHVFQVLVCDTTYIYNERKTECLH